MPATLRSSSLPSVSLEQAFCFGRLRTDTYEETTVLDSDVNDEDCQTWM